MTFLMFPKDTVVQINGEEMRLEKNLRCQTTLTQDQIRAALNAGMAEFVHPFPSCAGLLCKISSAHGTVICDNCFTLLPLPLRKMIGDCLYSGGPNDYEVLLDLARAWLKKRRQVAIELKDRVSDENKI